MSSSVVSVTPKVPERRPIRFWLYSIGLTGIILFTIIHSTGMALNSYKQARANRWMQQGRLVGQLIFNYSTDHFGQYPEGNRSTEIFQRLIDGGYTKDPTIFYLPLAGKREPIPGQKLQSENVCWDMTSCGDGNHSQSVPLVFMTGFKVDYVPGGAAVPLKARYPEYLPQRTYVEWLFGQSYPASDFHQGIAAFYTGNNATYRSTSADGSLPNFVPLDFKLDGKTYRQLTPDGVLK